MPSNRVTKILLNTIYYSGGASLANKSLRGLGSILMLHRTGTAKKSPFSPNNHLNVTPGFLEDAIKRLKSSIYEFVDLDEAAARIRGEAPIERLSRPFVCVTLDDGYRDNLANAVPIFRKYHIPYTIFIAPGLVDGRASLWWEDLEQLIDLRDRLDIDLPGGRVEIPMGTVAQKYEAFDFLLHHLTNDVDEVEQRRIMTQLCRLHKVDCEGHRARSIMDWSDLKLLAKDPLCTLGAHTIHHYAVARLQEDQARLEVEESGRLIELETGKRPRHFAYPYGYPAAAGPRDFAMTADAGYSTAVTTRHGVCYSAHGEHMTALPQDLVERQFPEIQICQNAFIRRHFPPCQQGGKTQYRLERCKSPDSRLLIVAWQC